MLLKYNLEEISSILLEPGAYRARLSRVEQAISSSKNPMLVWHWTVVSPKKYKGTELRSWTVLIDSNLFSLKEHLEAFGLKGNVQIDATKLVGKHVTLVVGTEVSERVVGEAVVTRERSNVIAVQSDTKQTHKLSRTELDELESEEDDDSELDYEEEDYDEEYEEEDEFEEDYDEEDDEDDEDEPDETSSLPVRKPAQKQRKLPTRAQERKKAKKPRKA